MPEGGRLSGIGGFLSPPVFASSSPLVGVNEVVRDMFRQLDGVIVLTIRKPTDDVVCFVSDLGMSYIPCHHVLIRVPGVGSSFQGLFRLWLFTIYLCVTVFDFGIVFLESAWRLRDVNYAHLF